MTALKKEYPSSIGIDETVTEMLNILEEGIGESVYRACKILKRGGIIAYPTDTIYGLGVDPEISHAVERLYELKERSEEKSVSLMFSGKEMLYQHFRDVSPLEKRAIDNLLPGAITIVLNNPADKIYPNETVGVRIPNKDFCRKLVEVYGKPITTTSVNKSGMPPAMSAFEVKTYFTDKIDLILDGGELSQSEGSTVIRINNENVEILRQGVLTEAEIMELINDNG